MIKVICKDDKFLVKGTFSIGIAGVFENKNYGEGNIEIQYGLKEMMEDRNKLLKPILDYSWMQPLKPILKNVPQDGDSVAKALEDYYNSKELMIRKNLKQINDYFFYRLILDFVDCAYPFWDTDEAVLPEYRNKYSREDFEALYDNDKLNNEIYALCDEFDKAPNDGSVEKTDVEALARRLFPMFDFDGLVQSINPDVLNLYGGWLQVQFSDGWGYNFFCSACEEFDENLAPNDWHNF